MVASTKAQPVLIPHVYSNRQLNTKISEILCKYDFTSQQKIILRHHIQLAYEYLSTFHDFDDISYLDKTEKAVAKNILKSGKKFLIVLKEWGDFFSHQKRETQDTASRIQALLQKAETTLKKTPKKSSGRRANISLATVLNPLFKGYFLATGRAPSVSKNRDKPGRKSDFHTFLERTLDVLVINSSPISSSTLNDYLKRWKKAQK